MKDAKNSSNSNSLNIKDDSIVSATGFHNSWNGGRTNNSYSAGSCSEPCSSQQGAQDSCGPQGEQGPQGPCGPQGEQGPQGPIGLRGPVGPCGPQGPVGATGATGATGPTGVPGALGPAGPQGEQGEPGATGPVGPMGPEGPQGERGFTGATGPVGPAGPRGETGFTGATGATGPIGPVGSRGETGITGATGATGPVGPVGPEGPQGERGFTGATGPVGPVGPEGPQGERGFTGATGATGSTGATGPRGEPGGIESFVYRFSTDPSITILGGQNFTFNGGSVPNNPNGIINTSGTVTTLARPGYYEVNFYATIIGVFASVSINLNGSPVTGGTLGAIIDTNLIEINAIVYVPTANSVLTISNNSLFAIRFVTLPHGGVTSGLIIKKLSSC